MGFLEAATGYEVVQKGALPKICHTYPTMIKNGAVIPYLKKIQNIYGSPETLLKFY